MENKKSFLKLDHVPISGSKLSVKIPTVGEILDDEQSYYTIVSSLSATPYQYMVQLDDMNIDFSKVSDYELFLALFPSFAKENMYLIFGNIFTKDYDIYFDEYKNSNVLYSPSNGFEYEIDESIYKELVAVIRKINNLSRFQGKPGNEHAKKYLIEKERKKQKRNANKPYAPYLENLVIALVNSPEFPYNYEQTMDLSIYKFNQSFKQIQTRVTFNNTMIGVYSGTVDTSKLNDKSCLSWLQIS